MKQLCMVNYVWGEYQQYIPLYLCFLGASYPEYDARIYLNTELTENVRKQLEILKDSYNNFTIIENFSADKYFTKKAQKNNQVMKSLRWLHFEEEFLKYEAIYVGDIDILICRENVSIFENHKQHCKLINRNYSNAKRAPFKKNKSPRYLFYLVRKYGIKKTVEYVNRESEKDIRFTGLHFMLTKEYYYKILPLVSKFCEELNRMVEGKESIFNICCYNNEAMLRTLVLMAELGDGKLMNSSDDSVQEGYRPDHGLHIGRYRNKGLAPGESEYIISHMEFYLQYITVKQSEIYKKIEKYFPEYIKEILSRMEDIYEERRKNNYNE